jgi:phytoene dehydrogenase-like protein
VREFAVIGGGIGGCSIAALLHAQGDDVVLIEKEAILGGCASTFQHGGRLYNAGATTLAGYHEGGIVRSLCERIGVELDVISTKKPITIIQNTKTCIRYGNVDTFVQEITRFYPHPKHAEFWNLVHSIGDAFYAMEGFWYSNRSTIAKLRSLFSYFPLLKKFWPYLHTNAHAFIHDFYGNPSDSFIDFLDAQIFIVTQAKSEQMNFFTAALALGYTFNETHYPIGGMGAVCTRITSKMEDVRTKCEVQSIERLGGMYHLNTSQGVIKARNLIMGTSHFESSQWFSDKEILDYYGRFEKKNNHQSAFVLYMTLKTERIFEHHTQIIAENTFPRTLSKSIFVSISDPSDDHISPNGEYSVTASIHTDARWWIGLEPAHYKKEKKQLESLLKEYICDTLSLSDKEIVQCFSATPKTFKKYIHRSQLGGNALTTKNLLPFLPSNDTPIKGFYQVGDTAYAAQGWPGIVMGVMNCARLIHG